jgi:ADP-ribose pyrophosphatase YjhB (NUDIX family)
MPKTPGVSVDILIIRNEKILLGLMTEKWNYEERQVYGVPGRDIRFRESIGDTVKRNIREEFNCDVTSYEVISVNANYALGGHYIGIGVRADIDGDPIVRLPEDWVSWDWFDQHKVPDNLFPATRNLIDSYINHRINVTE